MAKVISQETYDDVLKENIVEFSMSIEEARDETVKQFEAQGINLANIIKDLTINEETGNPVMKEAIDALREHVEEAKVLDENELDRQLGILTSELSKSVPHRVQASKSNVQEYLLKIMAYELKRSDHLKDSILHKAVLCAHAMTHKNPDIFEKRQLETINK
jgi:hypothetical protein